MPLPERTIAVRGAVVCFFAVCLVGGWQGLGADTCCQRGVIGAVVAYMGIRWVVKAINAILMKAMVTSWMDQSKEQAGDKPS